MDIDSFSWGPAETMPASSGLWWSEAAPWDGTCYQPPVDYQLITGLSMASPHHASAIRLRSQLIAAGYTPASAQGLSLQGMAAVAQDLVMYGTAYVQIRRAVLGRKITGLSVVPARWARRTRAGVIIQRDIDGDWVSQPIDGQVVPIYWPDASQQIYGLPDWIAAMQAIQLSEAAVLFRRRYYVNGTAAGFILHIDDPQMSATDVDNIKDVMRKTKGTGNFGNILIRTLGNGSKVEILPISELAARDDFEKIKSVTRDDILAAHRIPPQLLGIIPNNSGGFGDVAKAHDVYISNEIAPLRALIAESINAAAGGQIIKWG